jgi:HSP20 family protein
MARQEQQQNQGLIPLTTSTFNRPFARWPSLFPAFWENLMGEMADFSAEQPQTGLSVCEDKKNVYVEAALPGIKPNEIEVTLEKGILWIRGEKKEEEEDKEKRYYRRASNSFSYKVALPGHVDEKQEPKATYKDGIMRITFNKSQQSQAKKITVKSG